MIQLRTVEIEKDYPTFERWWVKHQGVTVPMNILPKLGVVAEQDGRGIAAAWLYMANCGTGVCWASWHVTNPAIPPKTAEAGLREVQGHLERLAKEMGYGIMFTQTNRPSLIRWFKLRNFIANHTNCVQLFRTL